MTTNLIEAICTVSVRKVLVGVSVGSPIVAILSIVASV